MFKCATKDSTNKTRVINEQVSKLQCLIAQKSLVLNFCTQCDRLSFKKLEDTIKKIRRDTKTMWFLLEKVWIV